MKGQRGKLFLELLREEEIEEVFRYLEIYRNSLSDDDEIQDVEELIRYYENNREGAPAIPVAGT